MTEQPNISLAAARAYRRRGWWPIPIPFRAKGPTARGWGDLRLEGEALAAAFSARCNVGVLLGEPSGWLVDVDLDWPEARELADQILPPTPAIFGRPGSPRSHRLYVAKGARYFKAEAPGIPKDEATICEIRATGQTVFPGSVHPSGEVIAWESDGKPAEIDAEALRLAVGRLAARAHLRRVGAVDVLELPEGHARKVREWLGEPEPSSPRPAAAPLSPPEDGLSWMEQVKARPVAEVARALGFEVHDGEGVRRGQIRPCPACGDSKRGSKERGQGRAPVEITSDRNRGGWECYRCKATGSSLDVLALKVAKRAELRGREWDPVRQRAEELGLCTPGAPRGRTRPPEPRPVRRPVYPPAKEVADLWARCLPLGDRRDIEAAEYLIARRGWSAEEAGAVADLDLARSLPLEGELPSWWPWRHPWRLMVPLFDAEGRMRSLHARRIDGDEIPKARSPRDFDESGLLLANEWGVQLLRGDAPQGLEAVLLAEGLTDTLRTAARVHLRARPWAVLGMLRGGGIALAHLGQRWPEGIPLYVATDEDNDGEGYAADAVRALPPGVRVQRVRFSKKGPNHE